jgi:glucosyl-dolichyl phosphate glucuronosyltransferase
MKLDVVIPTYNRHELLKRTLNSLLAAKIPSDLSVNITVVDNNSKDQTKEVVESYFEKFDGRLKYLFEIKQGRSPALNAGIEATNGDLIGMIDDDEEIDVNWYTCIQQAFSDPNVDFIGGPYIPRWGAKQPQWLPMNYLGVIGWVDGGDKIVPFDENYGGILMGGNAVIKRFILEKVGYYSVSLGRTDKNLLSCEDRDMYTRLLAAGARGFYRPDLIIYHYIPPERLTKKYFRQWCFWQNVSLGVFDREGGRQPVAYLAGVPRYLYGNVIRGIKQMGKEIFTGMKNPENYFSSELTVWDLAGYFYGKHFYHPSK